ncbi:MAG: PQQ-binding-like beta-propeller repeat protein [Planctomycetales bacterium]|nr:PQQ-binding-like beta-propeller repeat protein [Planctomycetales bacterium]
MHGSTPIRICLAAVCAVQLAFVSQGFASDWPGFRGDGRSVAESGAIPATWSIENGDNVVWQVDLPGRGVSGPIVADGKVFVTCSSGAKRDRLHVAAFDQKSGQRLWHRQFWADGRTFIHPLSAVAANTPAAADGRVFAFFSSNDLYALDYDGNVLWMRSLTRDYPKAGNDVGMSSSPVVAGDVVVVQSEAQAAGFVEALDVRTGKTRWQTERPRKASWCSPLAWTLESADGPQPVVLLQSLENVELRRAADGERLWSMPLPCEAIASATRVGEKVLVPSGGVRMLEWSDAAKSPTVEWQAVGVQPGNPSPVAYRGRLYAINRAGVLSCVDLATQKSAWKLRLGGSFWATPVAAGDRLLCVNQDGLAFVIQLPSDDENGKGEVLTKIEFGEEVLASPAVVDDGVYVRSHQHLWKLAD